MFSCSFGRCARSSSLPFFQMCVRKKQLCFSPFPFVVCAFHVNIFTPSDRRGVAAQQKHKTAIMCFLAEINFIPLMSALLHVLFSCSHMSQKYVHCIPLLEHFHTQHCISQQRVRSSGFRFQADICTQVEISTSK